MANGVKELPPEPSLKAGTVVRRVIKESPKPSVSAQSEPPAAPEETGGKLQRLRQKLSRGAAESELASLGPIRQYEPGAEGLEISILGQEVETEGRIERPEEIEAIRMVTDRFLRVAQQRQIGDKISYIDQQARYFAIELAKASGIEIADELLKGDLIADKKLARLIDRAREKLSLGALDDDQKAELLPVAAFVAKATELELELASGLTAQQKEAKKGLARWISISIEHLPARTRRKQARLAREEAELSQLAPSTQYDSEEFTYAKALTQLSEDRQETILRCRRAWRMFEAARRGRVVEGTLLDTIAQLQVDLATLPTLTEDDIIFLNSFSEILENRFQIPPAPTPEKQLETIVTFYRNNRREGHQIYLQALENAMIKTSPEATSKLLTAQLETEEHKRMLHGIEEKKEEWEEREKKAREEYEERLQKQEEAYQFVSNEDNQNELITKQTKWQQLETSTQREIAHLRPQIDALESEIQSREANIQQHEIELDSTNRPGFTLPRGYRTVQQYQSAINAVIENLRAEINHRRSEIKKIEGKIGNLEDEANQAQQEYILLREKFLRYITRLETSAGNYIETADILTNKKDPNSAIDQIKLVEKLEAAQQYLKQQKKDIEDYKKVKPVKNKKEAIEEVLNAIKARNEIIEDVSHGHVDIRSLSTPDGWRELVRINNKKTLSDMRLTYLLAASLELNVDLENLPSRKTAPAEFNQLWVEIGQAIRQRATAKFLTDLVTAIQNDRGQAIIQTGNPIKDPVREVPLPTTIKLHEITPAAEARRQAEAEARVREDTAYEALIRSGQFIGINTAGRLLNLQGEQYFVSDRIYRLEKSPDGTLRVNDLGEIGIQITTRGIEFTAGATAQMRSVREDVFAQIALDIIAQQGGKEIVMPDGQKLWIAKKEGKFIIQERGMIRKKEYLAEEYIYEHPDVKNILFQQGAADILAVVSPRRQDMIQLQQAKSTTEIIKGTTAITSIEPNDPPDQIIWHHPVDNNFRIVAFIEPTGISIEGQNQDTSGNWHSVPLNTGLAARLSLNEFLALSNTEDTDAFRNRVPAAFFDRLLAMSPEQRRQLDLQTVTIDIPDRTGTTTKRHEITINPAGELVIKDITTPGSPEIPLLKFLHEQILRNDQRYYRSADAAALMSNINLQIQREIGKEFLLALQRKKT